MAKDQYCIVDITVDSNLSIEGLTGMTFEAAQAWVAENQVELSEPIEIEGFSHSQKYSVQPDNWPTEEEISA